MGDLIVSKREGAEIVAIGLGSCIGLAMVDRGSGVAGMAHVVLPDSNGSAGPMGKFADTAVPEMIAQLGRLGAAKHRLQAVLIGGARMFSLGATMDIGARNVAAVREHLRTAGVRIHAEETGGNRGRTARVILGHEISSQVAGGERTCLMSLSGLVGAGR